MSGLRAYGVWSGIQILWLVKLLHITNLYLLGVYLVVFFLGGVLFLFLFQRILDDDINRKLHERKDYLVKQMTEPDSLLRYQNFSANTLSIEKTRNHLLQPEVVSDTVLFDEIEHKEIHYRQLVFFVAAGEATYKLHIRRALVEHKDLTKGVFLLEVFLFVAFVAILSFLNDQLSKRIWRPFYAIVDRINNYSVDRAENLSLSRGRIDEFNDLAASIERMSHKINQEFNAQKEFIENASHEIQTPLAIIRNKLEELLQLPELKEHHVQSITKASLAANRLSRLNESLLILSRIENRQFHVVEDMNMNELIDIHLNNFDELIQMKGIRIVRSMEDLVIAKMNPYLAEILIENIITNAIKHNQQNGTIRVTTEKNRIEISNTGSHATTDISSLFKRFAKADHKSSSLGLGLAIVKAICDTYEMEVHYSIDGENHIITVGFRT